MASRTNALVLPIFRRYWLWTAWAEPGAAAAAQPAARHWRQGATLEEKFQLLGQQISGRVRPWPATQMPWRTTLKSSAAALRPTLAAL
jgi:hypothetical protein